MEHFYIINNYTFSTYYFSIDIISEKKIWENAYLIKILKFIIIS